jgi:cell pole-organizing protein PopZ
MTKLPGKLPCGDSIPVSNAEIAAPAERGALMAQPAKAPEPSIDELLVRVRHILAEDDADKTAQHPTESKYGESDSPTPSQVSHATNVQDSVPGRQERRQLISKETNVAVYSAFNALAQTVLLHNARTLEDMVREMLQPILKVWLDDNLPRIVERLVRAEIERASQTR